MCAAILSIAPINGLEQQTDQNDECADALHMHSDCPFCEALSARARSRGVRCSFDERKTVERSIDQDGHSLHTDCTNGEANTTAQRQREKRRKRNMTKPQ